MEVVNLKEKLAQFSEQWSPKIVGEVNDSHVKLVKLSGEFVWHHHDGEDEMFLVLQGRLRMRTREGDLSIGPGEFVIVPRGVEHLPVAETETHVLLFEPRTTLNTGNLVNDRTVAQPERI
jgi:mannose-6-phosphate isomerase-like protein (cupin superfamily)